jgi:DNA-binding transcriptional LysR family regulator
MFRAAHGRARWIFEGPNGEESVEVHGAVSADDFGFVHQATLNGAGIAIMPQFLAEPSVARGELVRLLPRHLAWRGVWHLVYPTGRYLPRRAAAFRDFVLGELGAAPTG